MPTQHLYVALKPGEINGNLQALDGRLLVILPNYTELFPEPPKPTDGVSMVFAVEADEAELAIQSDGGRDRWYLWRGDKHSRSRPQDKGTLPIYPLAGTPAAEKADPREIAQQAFGGLPENVQLAGVIMTVDDSTLAELPAIKIAPAQLGAVRAWADSVLSQHVAQRGA